MVHTLKFYEKISGQCPVKDYLRAQNKAVRGEAGWLLDRLQREGNKLERPAADYVDDGLYELRVIVDRQQHRILYFFHGKMIVGTNAFLKKSAGLPKSEIDKARKARIDWLGRERGKNK